MTYKAETSVPRPNYQRMNLLEVCDKKKIAVGQNYQPLAQQIFFGENNRPIFKGDITEIKKAYNDCWSPYQNSETIRPLESGFFRGTLWELINKN